MSARVFLFESALDCYCDCGYSVGYSDSPKLSCVVHDVQLQENSNTIEPGNIWKNSYLPFFVITFHGCLCKLIHCCSIIQIFIHC
ncbi:hypothetical protein E1A91_A07G103000v1 [Gossypium mustelinum]|uniref:Uncharacterized protein n=1 Tax=Gossypium mustelinum TaxID=34275 RepID=A0A5D2YIG5_GOSMU|nr:hypothetical protein E1A91_A07G103000v1 [Gossypium mustelinum]